MREGSQIYLFAWGITLDQRLDNPFQRTAQGSEGWEKTLRGVLWTAMQNGVSVRLLASQNLKHRPQNEAMVKDVMRMSEPLKNRADVAAYFDKQVPNKWATHHQKTVFISSAGGQGPFLFVGGMDVMDMGQDWIDAQAEIVGQGAKLGFLSLQERWWSLHHRATAQQSWNPGPAKGTTSVQFVRSYCPPGSTGRTYEEDNTYAHLILNAIKNTKKFIYIEDQFFWWTPQITDALLQAVNERVTLVVITNHGDVETDPETGKRSNGTAYNADQIRDHTTAKHRVHLLYAPWRFVHTKAWVFDDEMAIVGSANYWDRSLITTNKDTRTIESEFGVGVVGDSAKSLRLSLWRRLFANARSAPTFPSESSTDFFGELAMLLGRTRDDVAAEGGELRTPQKPSPLLLIPPQP